MGENNFVFDAKVACACLFACLLASVPVCSLGVKHAVITHSLSFHLTWQDRMTTVLERRNTATRTNLLLMTVSFNKLSQMLHSSPTWRLASLFDITSDCVSTRQVHRTTQWNTLHALRNHLLPGNGPSTVLRLSQLHKPTSEPVARPTLRRRHPRPSLLPALAGANVAQPHILAHHLQDALCLWTSAPNRLSNCSYC